MSFNLKSSEFSEPDKQRERITLGKLGEDIACEYLKGKGYKIIERNVRWPWGELDIICRAPDKTLIFVEVKTMLQSKDGLQPEDQLSKSKLRKLQKTASLYAGHYPERINDKKGWRIDLIAITLKDFYNLTNIEESCDIKHYENI